MHNPNTVVFGFFGDFDREQQAVAALETFQNKEPGSPSQKSSPRAGNGDATGADTSSVYKKDGAYYAYLSVYDVLGDWGYNTNDFVIWLSTLSAEDTVYFSITGAAPSSIYLPLVLSAIDCCAAKTVFVVNHLVESPLFLAVVKEVDIRPTGAVTFSAGLNVDRNKYDIAWLPYLKSLFDRLVAKNLLTADEMTAILDTNAIIFKTQRQLKPEA